MAHLTVVATLKARSGQEKALLSALQGLVGPTRAEQGCITYAGYILGFPTDTPESIVRDIKIIQRELPLDIRIREDADGGAPTVIAEPGSTRAQAYFLMARRTAARLATLNKDYSRAFPKITVEAT